MSATPFAGLDPASLIAAVESLGLWCDGRVLALNSYENRVFRVGIEDDAPRVVKVYRPGRWNDAAIREEHAFALELAEAGLPVVAPLRVQGDTLHTHEGFRFALFPLQGGRAPEPGDRDTLRRLGQTLAQLHTIGARQRFRHRPTLGVAEHGRAPLAVLLAQPGLPPVLRDNLRQHGEALLALVSQRFARIEPFTRLRLHGDCHWGNLLWRDDQPHIVDLDDCLTGPAVQDCWMLLGASADELPRQRDWLLEGYTAFRDFDPLEWSLVEPLRALRLLHFHAWIAQRWDDPAFPRAFPWFGEPRHWESLLQQVQEQRAVLEHAD